MATKQVKKKTVVDVIGAMIEEYMDKAFATNDADLRDKYRELIRELQKLLLMVGEVE